jgi:ribonuclease Z
VNGPFGDPALFIPFLFEKRALLFDMGELRHLSAREILKITHGFVSHTHMDHFVGFDLLLRIFLERDKTLHIFGPPGFLRNVEGKLAGYTWNLVKESTHRLVLTATEVHADHTLTQVYDGRKGFGPQGAPVESPFNGCLLKEPAFSVLAVHLDHKTPCLAFRLEEGFHVNIMKDRLEALQLPVGPWLKRFKDAIYAGVRGEEDFSVEWEAEGKKKKVTFPFEDLAKKIARISPGQKVLYVVDVLFSPENAEKIVTFARDADQLFIEGAFLDVHGDTAERKHHLTARQAGLLARKAGVKAFTLFHFSPRYEGQAGLLEEEARQAFEEGEAF